LAAAGGVSRVRSQSRLGLLGAGLLIAAVLSGCAASSGADAGFETLEKTISSWEGVQSAEVSGAYDGLPTSRSLSVDITLDDALSVDLEEYLDRTLQAAWSYDVYEPSSVFVSFVDGSVPVADGYVPRTLDLTGPVDVLGLEDVAFGKEFLSVSSDEMVKHYGSWPAS